MSGLGIRILGSVEFVVGGVAVPVASAPARAVLSVLALRANTVVTTSDLIDLVWAERPPRTAANQVQIAIFRLRRAIGPGGRDPQTVLQTLSGGYRLNTTADGVDVDLEAYRRSAAYADAHVRAGDWTAADFEAARAIAVWRGQAFQDVDSERLRAAATVLGYELADTVECKLAADLQLGRLSVAEVGERIDAEPLRERLWFLLILAHALAGRTAEALACYRRLQKTLADELGIEPSQMLADLQRQVLLGQAQTGLATVRAWYARAPAEDRRRTWQAPAGIAHFVGRAGEIREAMAVLTAAGTRAVPVCIVGMGGVGKTALAVHLADQLREAVQDCLFVDLRGLDAGPAEPHDVVGSILRSLGLRGSSIPEDSDGRLGLLRSEITARRPLLILDNAADEKQVRPLLEAASAGLTIVTSRRALSGLDRVHTLELPVFTLAESMQLLSTVVSQEETAAHADAAYEIARLCGGLPLAVRVAAIRLARSKGGTLRRMADRLADEYARLDELAAGDREVRAVLAMSTSRLPPEGAVLLRRLALLPVPRARTWTAGAIVGASAAYAERVLENLAENSLVELSFDAGGGWYRLHDLVRLYARELADEADTAALKQVYEAMVSRSVSADRRLPMRAYPTEAVPAPHPDDHLHDWFDRDGPLLLRAVRDAADRGWTDPAWRILAAMTNFASLEQQVQEWLDLAGDILARLDGGPPGTAALQLGSGMLLHSRGHPHPALELLRQARRLYLHCGDLHRAATAATYMGMAYRSLGRWRPARAAVGWAIARLAAQPPSPQLGWAYLAMGNLLLEQTTDLDAAIGCYEQALAVMRATEDVAGEGNVLVCLAQTLRRQGSTDPMMVRYREAAAILERIDDPVGLCMVENGLGRAHMLAGDLDRAAAHARRALDLARASHHPQGLRTALQLAGEIALHEGRHGPALEHLTAAAALARETTGPIGLADTLHHLARAYLALGDRPAAAAAAGESLDIYTRLDRPERQKVADLCAAIERAPS